MRLTSRSAVLAIFIAVPAFGGPSVTVTPVGRIGSLTTNHDGSIEGYPTGYPIAGLPPGLPANLYDYAPISLGGQTPTLAWRAFSGVGGGPMFLDWVEPHAFGDDIELDTGQGHGFLTKIHYGYLNTAASATHVIRFYDMAPDDPPTGPGGVTVGSLLLSIALPAMPYGSNGMFVTWSTSAAIQLPESFWITFDEIGPGAPNTFWLSGTAEGPVDIAPGFSAQGLLALDAGAPSGSYGDWGQGNYPGDWYLLFDFIAGGWAINANMSVGLSGYFVPQPASIAVLALGGLFAMRRRR